MAGLGERPAIHDRHHEVEHDDVRAGNPELAQRVGAIAGRHHLESVVGEPRGGQVADAVLILDDHDALPGLTEPQSACH